MSMNSKIEWTDATWNPTRGCSRVSPGCKNCYAERQAIRQKNSGYKGLVTIVNGHPAWTGVVRALTGKTLEDPLHWKKPRRVFVNSMSDLFHEALPDEAIDRVFAVMALCPQHTFQVLTKRPERMLAWCDRLEQMAAAWRPNTKTGEFTPSDVLNLRWMHGTFGRGPAFPYHPWPLPNVWLGVSVEDRKNKDRIDILRQVPAAVRFLSIEPLLEDIGQLDLIGIDWVIAGGESGPGARPAPPEWFRSVRDQCEAAGVSFFFKQHGQWSPVGNASKRKYLDVPVGDGTHHRMFSVGKQAAGRLLDGREWNEFPQVSNVPLLQGGTKRTKDEGAITKCGLTH